MRTPLCAAVLTAFAFPASAQDLPQLTIYTYDSFVTEWGPGPAIEAAFEATCACDLVFSGHGDGAALLARLALEGPRTEADVVLGLDTALTAAAAETGMFAPHGLAPDLSLPAPWTDPLFLPYDYGFFAFVGNAGTEMPGNFEELADSDLSIVIQDPRSSTPGLGLVMWVKAAYGDASGGIWEGLADNIVTVTPGWSEAYGLFLEGEADLVLSYTTSPSYHALAEGDDSKVALPFAEGHYMQIEVAGIVAASDQRELAQAFLAFMVTDAFQSVIPETNWMFPAATPAGGLPEGFAVPEPADRSLVFSDTEAMALREEAIAEWRAALSR